MLGLRKAALIAALTIATASLALAQGPDSSPPSAKATAETGVAAPAAALAPAAPAPVSPIAAPAPDQAEAPDESAIRAIVRREAESRGMPAEIAEAVVSVESAYNPRAVGGVGEIGLMQVLPSTARMLGFSEPLPKLFDPETNIKYGVRYLGQAWKLTGEDICGTVMKYRAGHGETRFSHKSVAYCLRVRAILEKRGFKVTGTVPVATFGEPGGASAGAGAPRGVRRLANGRVRMRFNWAAVDVRRKTLDRAGSVSLRIAD